MPIDLGLLRRAYPGGLARKGVTTIGGWVCVGDHPNEEGMPKPGSDALKITEWWHPMEDRAAYFGVPLPKELTGPDARLPRLDPTDTATWACVLRDLAEAVNEGEARLDAERKQGDSYSFRFYPERGLMLRGHAGHWELVDCDFNRRHWIDNIEDPAVFVATVRARLREGGR